MAQLGRIFKIQRENLVKELLRDGTLKSEEVAHAILIVPREDFVWPSDKRSAYTDSPLPLGDSGQTISAPHMVAIMLEELDLRAGLEVLEIGAGSGYNAALMAEILRSKSAGGRGHITTMERIPSLLEFAKRNLERTGYSDFVTVVEGDGSLGYPEKSKKETYDRIVVTAAAPHIPQYLKMQLKVDGILLVPQGSLWVQNLVKVVKLGNGKFSMKTLVGCMFVPLVGADGYC